MPNTSHAQQAGVATTGHSTAHTSHRHGHHQSHGKGTGAHDVGSGRGTSGTGSTSKGVRTNVAPNTGIGGADAFSGDGRVTSQMSMVMCWVQSLVSRFDTLTGLTAGLRRPISLGPGPSSAKLPGGAHYDAIDGALDDRTARDTFRPALILAAIPKPD
ncbi:TPA: hypothetical protein ACH3X1_015990 [Trebouxia sp. C0004]